MQVTGRVRIGLSVKGGRNNERYNYSPRRFITSHSETLNTKNEQSGGGKGQIALDFEDTELAFKHLSTFQILKRYFIFKMCKKNYSLYLANKVLSFYEHQRTEQEGPFCRLRNRTIELTLSNLIRKTFFTHFIGGESEVQLRQTTTFLQSLSVTSILDYSLESPSTTTPKLEDSSTSSSTATSLNINKENEIKQLQPPSSVMTMRDSKTGIGKVCSGRKITNTPRRAASPSYYYPLNSQEYFDKNLDIKIKAIGEGAVCNPNTTPFTPLKLSGIMGSEFLKDFSQNLKEMETSFNSFGSKSHKTKQDFYEFVTQSLRLSISREQSDSIFVEIISRCHPMLTSISESTTLDFVTFLDFFDCQTDLIYLTEDEYKGRTSDKTKLLFRSVNFPLRCGTPQSESALPPSPLSNHNVYQSHVPRFEKFCQIAEQLQVRVLVDAEQTYLQPAIDYLTLKMERMFNKENVLIYNTYQCYLKATPNTLHNHFLRSLRLGYKMGVKLVRGAYLDSEKAESSHLFHDSIEETHNCYNQMIGFLYQNLYNLSVVFASHNVNSISLAASYHLQYKINPNEKKVFFAQLFGMSDNLTFILAQNNFCAMKIVPYGPLHICLPYLIRRVQENASFLQGNRETDILRKELKRRIFMVK